MSIIKWIKGAGGSFGAQANWSPHQVPASADEVVLGKLGKGAPYAVTSSTAETIDDLDVAYKSATLSVSDDSIFTIGASLSNQGAISVADGSELSLGSEGAPLATFAFVNSGRINLNAGATMAIHASIVTMSGGGSVVLSEGSAIEGGSAATPAEAAQYDALVNAGDTISGVGTIGDDTMTLDNGAGGKIIANANPTGSASALLTLNTGSSLIENDGLIETLYRGSLDIESSIRDNGSIIAAGSGTITFADDDLVTGFGALRATGSSAVIALKQANVELQGAIVTVGAKKVGANTLAGSQITIAAGATDILDASSINNGGAIDIGVGANLLMQGNVVNSGVIAFTGTSSASKLEVQGGGLVLRGAGRVILADTLDDAIVSAGQDAQFINYGNTIEGSGRIGDGLLQIENMSGAVIDSDGSAGMTLAASAVTAGPSSVNNGLIEATGGGTLTIEGDWSGSGAFKAAAASNGHPQIELEDAYLLSGSLIVAAHDIVTTLAGSTNEVAAAITSAGTIDIDDQLLVLGPQIVNSGTIDFQSTANNAVYANEVEFASSTGVTTLSGGGFVDLYDSSAQELITNGSLQTLDNVGDTIQGYATIGSADLTLINGAGGVIDANNATNAMTITTGSNAIQNAGLIELTGAGGLTIEGAIDNSGFIDVSAGHLDIQGVATATGNSNKVVSGNSTGGAIISGSGELEFGGASDMAVTFLASSGTDDILKIDHGASTQAAGATGADTGYIFGFTNAGAEVDLADLADNYIKVNVTVNTNELGSWDVVNLSNSNGASETLYFFGNIPGSMYFIPESDGHGGTMLTYNANPNPPG